MITLYFFIFWFQKPLDFSEEDGKKETSPAIPKTLFDEQDILQTRPQTQGILEQLSSELSYLWNKCFWGNSYKCVLRVIDLNLFQWFVWYWVLNTLDTFGNCQRQVL